jgi:hypothetical protein
MRWGAAGLSGQRTEPAAVERWNQTAVGAVIPAARSKRSAPASASPTTMSPRGQASMLSRSITGRAVPRSDSEIATVARTMMVART